MKKRIWNQAKGLAVSAVLLTMSVNGNWGQATEIKASDVDNKVLSIVQSAQWAEEGTYRAQIQMEVSGLLAYKEKYEQFSQEEESGASGGIEETPGGDVIDGVTEEPVESGETAENLNEKTWEDYGWESTEDNIEDNTEDNIENNIEDQENNSVTESEVKSEGAAEEAWSENRYAEEEALKPETDSPLPQLYVENYISEYFEPAAESMPDGCWIDSCKAVNQKGEEITLGKVIASVDVPAITEDVISFSFEAVLREEYRASAEAVSYPVSQDAPLNKDCEGTGAHILEVQGLENRILGQAPSPFLEVKAGNADFELALNGEAVEVKAGRLYTYELNVENTGSLPLSDIQIQSDIHIEETDSKEVKAVWESAPNVEVNGRQARILSLGSGESCRLLMKVQLSEGDRGSFVHQVAVSAPCPKNPAERIGKEARAEALILPLKADFTVEKTADRTIAYPGDTIHYQICIRNTGERTLHSVLSTERFLGANVQAQFLPKEGVTLNAGRTQALIEKIEPGHTFALQAEVTLPQNFTARELVNQVTVISEETGTKNYESQSKIGVAYQQATPTSIPYGAYQVDYTSGNTGKSAYPVTSLPKTGDDTEIGIFLMLLSLAALAGTGVFWKLKGKSKD